MTPSSQLSLSAQYLPGGSNKNPKSPIYGRFADQFGGKKQRLCSFSTTASEAMSQSTNELASPKCEDSPLINPHIFKHPATSRFSSFLAELLPQLPNGPPSIAPISEFLEVEDCQTPDQDDSEQLLPKMSSPVLSVGDRSLDLAADKNGSDGPQPATRSTSAAQEKLAKLIALFDRLAAKELASAAEPVHRKVQEVVETVGTFVKNISSQAKGDRSCILNSQERVGGGFVFGSILKIPSIIKRALSCEELRLSSKAEALPQNLQDRGCSPKVLPNISQTAIIHLRDHKDRNIFEDSPMFPFGKIANYSPEATAKIQEFRIARAMFSITLPLQWLGSECIEKQFKLYEASPATYISNFSCPSLVEIESHLSIPIGMFGLKDHTQQLSVWVASLSLQEQLLEFLLSVLPEGSTSSQLRFCKYYFEVSLQQTREYRRTGLSLHLNSVATETNSRSSSQHQT